MIDLLKLQGLTSTPKKRKFCQAVTYTSAVSQLDFAPYIKSGIKKTKSCGATSKFYSVLYIFRTDIFVVFNLNRQNVFLQRGVEGGRDIVLSQEGLFSSGEVSPRLLYRSP